MILRVFRVRGPEGQDAAVLRGVEVVVVSRWRSWDDIQAWTGPDVTRPLDRELPEMFDIRIEHFESVERGATAGSAALGGADARPAEAPSI